MLSYIVRRILLTIPVLIGILLVTFLLARVIPGDPCHSMLGEKASVEACERFDANNGLDKPIPVQFGIYINGIAHGDFGESIRFSRPITQILVERLPMTIELSLAGLFIAVVVGVPLGILAARKHNTGTDIATMTMANIGVSMPVFWLGLLLAYFFALVLKDTPFQLPPSGRMIRRRYRPTVLRSVAMGPWRRWKGQVLGVLRQPRDLQLNCHGPVGGRQGRHQAPHPSSGCARHHPDVDYYSHDPILPA